MKNIIGLIIVMIFILPILFVTFLMVVLHDLGIIEIPINKNL